MRTATHKLNGKHKHLLHPKKSALIRKATSRIKAISLSTNIKPIKRLNKKVMTYVTHNPYQTMGVAALVSGVVIGLIYTKFK